MAHLELRPQPCPQPSWASHAPLERQFALWHRYVKNRDSMKTEYQYLMQAGYKILGVTPATKAAVRDSGRTFVDTLFVVESFTEERNALSGAVKQGNLLKDTLHFCKVPQTLKLSLPPTISLCIRKVLERTAPLAIAAALRSSKGA